MDSAVLFSNRRDTMEMQINAGGFTHTITVTAAQEGVRRVGAQRKVLLLVGGELVPVFRAYCDQLSMISTEGETEAVAIEKMRLAAIETYNAVAQ